MVNAEEVKLKLLANRPIFLPEAGFIYPPTLNQIIDIGFGGYNELLSCLLIDKTAFKQQPQEEFVNSDIFFFNCLQNIEFRKLSEQIASVLFRSESSFFTTEETIGIRVGESGCIKHENFDDFQTILRLMNNIKEPESEPEYKAGNSKAQEMINMIMRNKKKQPKPKANSKMDLHSIISGLAWKDNGINLTNIFDLNIYQIYNGLFTTNNIDNYNFTVTGVYAGTLDGKKIKMEDLHWANKIKEDT